MSKTKQEMRKTGTRGKTDADYLYKRFERGITYDGDRGVCYG